MRYARYALLMASLIFPACNSEMNEVTAPVKPPPPPQAGAAEWGPARTRTPTRTSTATASRTPTRTSTNTPTPVPFDLTGWWIGLFIYNTTCSDSVFVTLLQQGNSISGSFPTTCFGNDSIEISGTLQGNTLSITLLDDGQAVAFLTGWATGSLIHLHNSNHTTRLDLHVDY